MSNFVQLKDGKFILGRFSEGNFDTFSRLRTSEPTTVFDYNFSNNVDFDIYWSEKLESGATATHESDDASYELAVTTTIGSKATLMSRRHMQYLTGKSHVAYFTGNPNTIQQGMRKRLGLFTGSDGYFFEATDTGLRVVIRKNGTDTKIEQADWNGDKVDGTGTSGITGDLTKQKLFSIEVGWLGTNMIRFGQIIDGMNIIMHTHYAANKLPEPFTQTAVLPFRLELECIATATTADSLRLTCFSYQYEGRNSKAQRLRSWDGGLTSLTVNTTQKCYFGIRINSAYGESAIDMVEAILTLASGNSVVRWQLIHNPTITGSPTWNDEYQSIAQTLDDPTGLDYSGGFTAISGYINVGSTFEIDLTKTDISLGHDIDENFDVFIIVAETLTSNSKLLTQVDWKEFS